MRDAKGNCKQKWSREILAGEMRGRRPQEFAQPIFFSRFFLASRRTDVAKEGLLYNFFAGVAT